MERLSSWSGERTARLLSDLLVVFGLELLEDLNAVVDKGWRRVEHQRTTVTSISLGLLLLLGFRGLVFLLLDFLLGSYGQVLDALDSRVDCIFDCVGHVDVVVVVESEARSAGL